MTKILVFCLGNICRSPAAEVILRKKLTDNSLVEDLDFVLDSAGTGDWHVGLSPDPRSIEVCKKHKTPCDQLKARQIKKEDGEIYDYILGMDYSNLENAKKAIDKKHHHKIQLFDFLAENEVRDPYFGLVDGFEIMYQQLESASDHWVKIVKANSN